jgi:DNA-binding SARP family transcriptional activator
MPVVHDGEVYRLNLDAGVATDVMTFDALAHRGDQAWRSGAATVACDFYQRAIALYRGDLQGCEEESAVVERERFRAEYMVMHGRMADAARREGDYTRAMDHASVVLQCDAGREDAHRTLMACYAQLDQRVQAMRQYQLCERILREAFEAVPEPQTRALFDQLRLHPGTGVEQERCIS